MNKQLVLLIAVFLDSIIVSEGANTMDIGRTILLNRLPRHRLDAGIIAVSLFVI